MVNGYDGTWFHDAVESEGYVSALGRWQESESQGCVSAWERWQETESEGRDAGRRVSPRVARRRWMVPCDRGRVLCCKASCVIWGGVSCEGWGSVSLHRDSAEGTADSRAKRGA